MEVLRRPSSDVGRQNITTANSYVCFVSVSEPEDDPAPPPSSPESIEEQNGMSPPPPSQQQQQHPQQEEEEEEEDEEPLYHSLHSVESPYAHSRVKSRRDDGAGEDAAASTAKRLAKAISLNCVVPSPSPPPSSSEYLDSSDSLLCRRAVDLTARALNESKLLVNAIFEVCRKSDASLPRFLVDEDRSRLSFLKSTLDLVIDYLSQQSTSVFADADAQAFLSTLIDRLQQVKQMLAKIYRRESAMTANFDIFELTLRRCLDQLQWLFPVGQVPTSRPEAKIESPEARQAWIDAFGVGTFIVDFDSFVAKVVEKTPSFRRISAEERSKALLFLRYFIDFPSDDMVTPYKWNLMVRLFGPYDHFVENFLNIALGGGFLGLINRIQAQEILLLNPSPRAVVIRFSRTAPNYLAFTYKDATRCDGTPQIGNLLNSDPATRHVVPCNVFMRYQFRGFKLVPQRLNVGTILGESHTASLVDYASRHSGYIV